jgi:hypothetical protein
MPNLCWDPARGLPVGLLEAMARFCNPPKATLAPAIVRFRKIRLEVDI